MERKKIILIALLVLVVLGVAYGAQLVSSYVPGIAKLFLDPPEDIAAVVEEEDSPLRITEGFRLRVFAEGLDGPRVLERDPSGNLLVSQTRAGNVVALVDKNNDGIQEHVVVVDNLNKPHGLLTRCGFDELGVERLCTLFIAEEHMVSAYQYDKETLQAFNRRELIALPTEGRGHFTRTLMEHPDGRRLLVSVGSSCNVCVEQDPRRAAILVFDPSNPTSEIFARGLRNAVFLALHPITGEIWATENGRDLLGDDIPPDEINIVREGGDYGWPYCYGRGTHDSAFDDRRFIRNPCEDVNGSHIDVEAHSAVLGLAFVPRRSAWPAAYDDDLIVAYHGSWNRTEPTGYKIVRFELDARGNEIGREDFVSGWLTDDDDVLGRPVDIRIEESGVMYVTDDHADVIYEITYEG